MVSRSDVIDVLVIGSGGAGLRAAVEAAGHGNLTVAVMSKTMPVRSATSMAEGGINGVLGYSSAYDISEKDDSWELHALDTVKGSDFLADQDAVNFFVEQCARAVNETDCWGLPYNRDDDGRISRRKMGGHSRARTCFSADRTGQKIVHAVFNHSLTRRIRFMPDWQLLDLAVDNGAVAGVVARNIKTGDFNFIPAKAVVLATGGYSRIFWGRTSNPFGSTGDGVAVAMRAGLHFKDPEMIQFHPTGFARSGALLTEAARGEGGYLRNAAGERFMERYDHERMELSLRDIVARAIETEMLEGRGYGEPGEAHVFIDLRHLNRDLIINRLTNIVRGVRLFEDVDLITQQVPVRPTAHYSMGGIDITDYRTMATSMPGVFAAGECACVSIHGANRLGGNSLAEALVMGRQAGAGAAAYATKLGYTGVSKDASVTVKNVVKKWEDCFREVASRRNVANIPEIRNTMASVLGAHAGVFRSGDGLEKAAEEVENLIIAYGETGIGNENPVYNTAFTGYVEVGNMLLLSRAVIAAALGRRESRGAHYRLDYPGRDDKNYIKHSLVGLDDNNTLKVSYRPVNTTCGYKAEDIK